MKKKSIRILLVSAIIVILLAGIAGVALYKLGLFEDSMLLPSDSTATAEDNPFLVDKGFGSPEVTLDGVLDEEQWQNLKVVSYGSTYNTKVKGFYGKSGIYIAAMVEDKDLCAASSAVWKNTSFELYIDKTGEGGKRTASNHLEFFLDITETKVTRVGYEGSWQDTEIICNYGVTIDGTVDDKIEDKGYTMEMFIPYSQLGNDMDVNYGIAFGTVGCSEGLRNRWYGLPGVDPQIPDTYYVFYRDTNEIAAPRKVNKAKYKIDGKADDKIWNNLEKFSFGTNGYGKVSTYTASEGLYFFFEMQDDKVCSKGNLTYTNDSVELYFDTLSDGGAKPQADDYQIRIDVDGNIETMVGNGTTWAGCRNNVFAGIQKTKTATRFTILVILTGCIKNF